MQKEKTDVYSLDRWEKYYKIYTYLPLIIGALILFLSFVWGIVDATVFRHYDYYDRNHTYGIMNLSSGFLCWFIWMLIGAISAAITYFFMNVKLSYQAMHIIYLRKLAGINNESDFTQSESNKDLQENIEDEI